MQQTNSSIEKNTRLEYEQVANMLAAMEKLLASADDDPALDEIMENIEEACWLAQWKREYVILDFEQLAILETYSAAL